MLRGTVALALALVACEEASSPPVRVPVTHVVVLPRPEDEAAQSASSPRRPALVCPPDAFAEGGRCVRVVASPEIPAWTPPPGQLDPCATWTSDAGIYDCDPQKENAQ